MYFIGMASCPRGTSGICRILKVDIYVDIDIDIEIHTHTRTRIRIHFDVGIDRR